MSENDEPQDGDADGEPIDPASGRPAEVVPPTKIERPTAAAPPTKAPAEAAKPAGRRIEDVAPAKPKPPAEPSRVEQGYPGDPPPWWKTLRADPPALMRLGLGIAFLALLIVLWWLAALRPNAKLLLPTPGKTLHDFPQLLERHFGDDIFASMRRVLIGIGLAAFFGVGLGILAGAQRGVAAALNPLVVFLRSIPMGALGPLMLILFSTGEKSKWMFIFIAVVPFVFSDTLKAMSSVPQRYVETAETLGASRLQIVRKVLVPLALPDIITSLRFQFGLALGYIVLAETTGILDTGIGHFFNLSQQRGLQSHIWAALFTIAAIAFLIDYLIRFFQRYAFPYRKDL